jgi:hypothetical protein
VARIPRRAVRLGPWKQISNVWTETAGYNIEHACAEFSTLAQMAAWSPTAYNKSRARYPEYPRKMKDQMKRIENQVGQDGR